MELWNRFIVSHFRSRLDYRRIVQILKTVLACYVLVVSPSVVLTESCGTCQKKFVWTTAWPMEENYVTYKLIGPLIDKSQLSLTQPLSSSSPNQQYGFEEKAQPAVTEANERIERIGIKTEVELDELPGKFDAYNNEDQSHHRVISLINPCSIDNSSFSYFNNKNGPVQQREVFSARKSEGSIHDPKTHTVELVSKAKKGSYGRRNAKFQPMLNCSSKPASNLNNIMVMPELVSKSKSMSFTEMSEGFPFDSPKQISKPNQWDFLDLQQPAVKKSHSSPMNRKTKVQDQAPLILTPNMETSAAVKEPAITKVHPCSKTNFRSDSLSESNILKIVKMKPDALRKPMNDSLNLHDVDSLHSPFGKAKGRAPQFHLGNSSISRFPGYHHNLNLKKGCKVCSSDDSKGMNSVKEINSEPKCGHPDKSQSEVPKTSGKNNVVHKKLVGKREKLPSTGENNSIKKRRENPNSKDSTRDRLTAQRSPGAMQQRMRKMPLRNKARNNKLNGISSEHNSSFLSWFKDLSSPLEQTKSNSEGQN